MRYRHWLTLDPPAALCRDRLIGPRKVGCRGAGGRSGLVL